MKLSYVLLFLAAAVSGCSSLAVNDKSAEDYAKEFNPPPAGWSGLYLYRTCNLWGAGLHKNLYVDGQYIGETTRCLFFYRLVKPGQHVVQTESEFGENEVTVNFVEGQNYFVNQYIRYGVLVPGAGIEVREPGYAKKHIVEYELADNKDDPSKNLESFVNAPGKGSVPGPRSSAEAASMAR